MEGRKGGGAQLPCLRLLDGSREREREGESKRPLEAMRYGSRRRRKYRRAGRTCIANRLILHIIPAQRSFTIQVPAASTRVYPFRESCLYSPEVNRFSLKYGTRANEFGTKGSAEGTTEVATEWNVFRSRIRPSGCGLPEPSSSFHPS